MPSFDVDQKILRELLAQFPDTVILVDEERRLRFVNRFEAGYDETAIGQEVLNFIAPESRESHTRLIERVFATGQSSRTPRTEVIGADGSSEWYEGDMIPLMRDGRVAAVAIVSRNVTERERTENELKLLQRLLPVCAWCKKIRTEEDEWQSLETYLESTRSSRVTHGMCPDCERRMLDDGK